MQISKRAAATRIALYLIAVILVFSIISIAYSSGIVEIGPGPGGVADLCAVDFSDRAVSVSTAAATVYEGAFYTAEDFAAGDVTGGAPPDERNTAPGDFGTVRFVLRLPPGQVYAVASRSYAYAQRLFIDGAEFSPVGTVGRTRGEVAPMVTKFTEVFLPAGDETEIILHYANLVHPDPGSIYPLCIGLVRKVERIEQLGSAQSFIVTGALLAAMLFFFGLFTFYTSHRYLLWFSLACGVIALRGLLTGDKLLTLALPQLEWVTLLRLEYLASSGMVLLSALYLDSLFRGVLHRRVIVGFTVFCLASALLFALTPPMVFARLVWYTLAVTVLFFVYALAVTFAAIARRRASSLFTGVEQVLLMAGITIYLLLSAFEIYAHERAMFFLGLDMAQVGMLVCVFTSVLAISLSMAHLERSLDETKRSEREIAETNRMLEKLDKLRTDFLANITHEMKTPLTVMRGYALLAVQDIDEGTVDRATRQHLQIISSEAQRLADLAAGLLRDSAETEQAGRRRILTVREIFDRTADTLRPIMVKHRNRLDIRIADGLPPVHADGDALHQVLINLATNANRHTLGGVVTFSAEAGEGGAVTFAVADNGSGIPAEVLPHVFERHVSGDNGNGLGLPICKEHIEMHGGTITIESAWGRGTTVRFTLPRAAGEEDV